MILRRNPSNGSKVLEIRSSESTDDELEQISLNDLVLTVQDKESQNKKRFPFEVTIIIINNNILSRFNKAISFSLCM